MGLELILENSYRAIKIALFCSQRIGYVDCNYVSRLLNIEVVILSNSYLKSYYIGDGGSSIMKHKKRLFYLISVVMVVFLVIGNLCAADNRSADSWSVFLYLCGTDLETEAGLATDNIMELLKVDLSPKVKFVMQTGGTEEWWNEVIDPDRLERWELIDQELYLVDEQPLASMGDPETLGDFLRWGVENYPADKYMVVFWNHGGGSVAGVEFDELFAMDSLSLDELAKGLAMAGVQFELIGFDTCLMGSLETAAAVAPYARYMVASEELEPGGGWDYWSWLQYISDHPEKDGLEVGKVICDSYYEKCKLCGDEAMATLSVIDLAVIPELLECFDAMAAEMMGVTGDLSSLRRFVQGVTRAENYGGNNEDEGFANMVDLGDLIRNTERVLPETSEEVLKALSSAVQYNVKGKSRAKANGLSVYFPLAVNYEELDAYAYQAATSMNYLRFLEALTDWKASEELVAGVPPVEQAVQKDDYDVELESYIDEDGYFVLEITNGLEIVNSVQFSLYYMDYEYDEYMLLGYDNDIEADWENGVFIDNFRGVWPSINGLYCAPTLLAEEEDYSLYSIPILLNGKETNLRAAYIWESDDEGYFKIYGAWDGIDPETGMSAREIIKLKDGDEVTPLFEAVNWDTGEENIYELGSFIVDGAVVMEESELIDGDYLYQYKVIDIFGREFYSDEVIMECEDGEIYIYETEDEEDWW